ncbi:SGNH hydrolase domain-containing protein [Streptomyces sp. SCSIO 75703]|uniref:SGNH hydrolase domain-containing protein n=1 Tax=Streptomyces sp. SCSIO 75703 TaxID=3112165 RepID=UPI0030D2517D
MDNERKTFTTHRRFPSPRRTLTAATAAVLLGATLLACGGGEGEDTRSEGQADRTAASEPAGSGGEVRLLWAGDSIAGAQAPALGAALEAAGVKFRNAASDGGGTIVAGGDEITKKISGDTWKTLRKQIESFKPTVIAYQITTYDWGTAEQQREAYGTLVSTAEETGAKAVFVSAPPVEIDDFYRPHEKQMKTAPESAAETAEAHADKALFVDSGPLWGEDASAPKAQRAADGIHNCQQGAAAFANWFVRILGDEEGFTPAEPGAWATGEWTDDKRFAQLGCES